MKAFGHHTTGIQSGFWLQDCLVVVLVTLLASSPYLGQLGFHGDDWSILSTFVFAADQSLGGLIRSIFAGEPNTLARPLQALQYAALFRPFGLVPVGYHVANTLVFALGLCACYGSARALLGSRVAALALALVYGSLPHYSSDRFWYATFNANLSMALYFVSLYCDTRRATSVPPGAWRWQASATLSLVASTLAYEVFMPLFLINPLLVALKHHVEVRAGRTQRAHPGQLSWLANPLALALVVVFKKATSRRVGGVDLGFMWDAFPAARDLTFGAYGANLPHILWTIWERHWIWPDFVLVLLLFPIVLIYLLRANGQEAALRLPGAVALVLTVAASLAVAGASYAFFYGFFGVNAGVNNRVAIAASVAVAVAIVAAVGLLSGSAKRRPSRVACAAIAAICTCGYLIVNSIASSWIEASRRQDAILSGVSRALPAPASGSTVLIGGYCPLIGSGIVFDTDWDITGALRILYRDRTLNGNVLRPWLTANDEGMAFGNQLYPYQSLHYFDVARGTIRRVADRASAQQVIDESARGAAGGCLAEYRASGTGLPLW